MHPLFEKASGLTESISAAAIEVLVEGCVLVEAKAVEKIQPIHKAQLLSYMKLLNVPLNPGCDAKQSQKWNWLPAVLAA